MLSIQHLTKVYSPANVKALDDVTFDVPRGQFLAVIGLSGSGKSTLLRCINRLIDPTSGTILLDDQDVTGANAEELRRIRRRIGMVFQHFNLVHRSSVLTNVLAGDWVKSTQMELDQPLSKEIMDETCCAAPQGMRQSQTRR
jgi:phosphonate transport system ATP-binding protein